jgi:hypothetical protein
MRTVQTAVLSVVFLGAATSLGWSPEPANLGGALSNSSGATGAARLDTSPPPAVPWEFSPNNPENMTRSQRLEMVGHEKAAGRLKTLQELKNFLATGNPAKSWTPPEQKPPVKPASMSDAKWQEFLRTRPKPPDYVRGTAITPALPSGSPLRTMEQNAKLQGGTLTDLPGAVAIPPPSAKTTSTAPAPRYEPVTKLGVHPTSAAVDRLGSSQGATGGSKTTARAGAAVLEKAHSPAPTMSALDRLSGVSTSGAPAGNKNSARSTAMKDAGHTTAPQMAPHNSITPPAQRSQDTFRQPK